MTVKLITFTFSTFIFNYFLNKLKTIPKLHKIRNLRLVVNVYYYLVVVMISCAVGTHTS